MSASIILIPIAFAIITSSVEALESSTSSIDDVSANTHIHPIADTIELQQNNVNEGILTKYNSCEILKKSLIEHGSAVDVINDNCVVATFNGGKIRYERPDSNSPYMMYVMDVDNVDNLVCTIRSIETEYAGNVQSYTYNRVINDLPKGMHVESEEVLEDNTILLTITVD